MRDSAAEAQNAALSVRSAVGLGLLLLTLDFATKAVAIARLPVDELVPTVVPFFSWHLSYNTGSHYLFGAVGEAIPYRLLMAVAGLGVIGLTAYMARDMRHLPRSPLRTIQLLMIAGLVGTLGNALEVVALGRATDFFMIHPFPWPANLCDQFVNATVFVLLPLSLLSARRQPNGQKPAC